MRRATATASSEEKQMATKPVIPTGDFPSSPFTTFSGGGGGGDLYSVVMGGGVARFGSLMTAIFGMFGGGGGGGGGGGDFSTFFGGGGDFSSFFNGGGDSPFSSFMPGNGKPKPALTWGEIGPGSKVRDTFDRDDDKVTFFEDGWQRVDHPDGNKSLIGPDGTTYKWDKDKKKWMWVSNAPPGAGSPQPPVRWGPTGPNVPKKDEFTRGEDNVILYQNDWQLVTHPDGTKSLISPEGTTYEWNGKDRWDWVSNSPSGTAPKPPLRWDRNGPGTSNRKESEIGGVTIIQIDGGYRIEDNGTTRKLYTPDGSIYEWNETDTRWDWVSSRKKKTTTPAP
jgi:hypothetical protein